MDKTNKLPVLAYTEEELEAIKKFEAHKGEPLTLQELGIQPCVYARLERKKKEVEEGRRLNPDGLPLLDIKKSFKEFVKTIVETKPVYCI